MSKFSEEYQEKGSVHELNTCLSAISTKLEQIRRSVDTCPDEILALKNEITDLKLILPDVGGKDRELESGRRHHPLPAISKLLGRLEESLQRVYKAVTEYLAAAEHSTPLSRFSRNGNRHRRLRELADLQQGLSELRKELHAAIPSSSGVMRVDLTLLDMFKDTKAARVADERMQIDTAQAVLRKTREMKRSFLSSEFQDHSNGAHKGLSSANAIVDQQITSLVKMLPSKSVETNNVSMQKATIYHIGVTVSRYDRGSCKSWCSCICHQRYSFNTPKIFQKIFGTLFCGYSGLPLGRQKCSKASCKRNTTFTARATYYFPCWYLSRAISLGLINGLSEISMSITIRPVVRRSELYVFAAQGNVLAAQNLLSKKLANPNEVHTSFGNTALHYAIEFGQPEFCELLLNAGADPAIENSVGSSAVEKAWTIILTQRDNPDLVDKFKRLFGDGDVVEEMGFSILHKVLVGLIPLDLKDLLEASGTDIDAVDLENRTALSWAAQRGDPQAVRRLLKYEADPNICSKLKASPLHFALRSKSSECVRLLVNAKASVFARDWGGWPPVHTAAMNQDDPAYMEPLINAGANVNEALTPGRGKTALHRTAVNNRALMAACLLDHNAFIDQQSTGGTTPLFEAIDFGSLDVIRLLLQRGADYKICDDVGQSILHRIATKGNLKLLDVFNGFNLSGLDAHARDALGYTAMDILNGNRNVAIAPEFRTAFEQFIARLRPPDTNRFRGGNGESQSDTDSDAEYFEAYEIIQDPTSTIMNNLSNIQTILGAA